MIEEYAKAAYLAYIKDVAGLWPDWDTALAVEYKEAWYRVVREILAIAGDDLKGGKGT